MKRNPFLAAALLSLGAALPLAAQGGWHTPKGDEFPFHFGSLGLSTLMKEAGLSEAQLRQFQEIFQSNRHQLIDLRADVEKKEGDLQVLLDGPQVDSAQAERAVDALLGARNRLSKEATMMMVRMRQVVTPEQWRKMAELQRRHAPPPGVGAGVGTGLGGAPRPAPGPAPRPGHAPGPPPGAPPPPPEV